MLVAAQASKHRKARFTIFDPHKIFLLDAVNAKHPEFDHIWSNLSQNRSDSYS